MKLKLKRNEDNRGNKSLAKMRFSGTFSFYSTPNIISILLVAKASVMLTVIH